MRVLVDTNVLLRRTQPDDPSHAVDVESVARLIAAGELLGTKVHDARLVAAMNVRGVGKVLTFNTADFSRFEVEAVHPSSLLT